MSSSSQSSVASLSHVSTSTSSSSYSPPFTAERPARVFISYVNRDDTALYGFNVKDLVNTFSNRLRKYEFIDCQIDAYEEHSPPDVWNKWMADRVSESDAIIFVPTTSYRDRMNNAGTGVHYEASCIYQAVGKAVKSRSNPPKLVFPIKFVQSFENKERDVTTAEIIVGWPEHCTKVRVDISEDEKNSQQWVSDELLNRLQRFNPSPAPALGNTGYIPRSDAGPDIMTSRRSISQDERKTNRSRGSINQDYSSSSPPAQRRWAHWDHPDVDFDYDTADYEADDKAGELMRKPGTRWGEPPGSMQPVMFDARVRTALEKMRFEHLIGNMFRRNSDGHYLCTLVDLQTTFDGKQAKKLLKHNIPSTGNVLNAQVARDAGENW